MFINPSDKTISPLAGSVYEVDVLVQCREDGRVEPMFMEYDPKTDTLRSYLKDSIRIKRKPGCEWGRTLEDGWRLFQFVVCKGPQSEPTKAAHTVHRFICLGYDSRHQQQQGSSSSSSCSPPLPQQQGSSHCYYPPLPQYNEMEPLLTDTIRQLRREKEDLLQGDRQRHDLLLAENLRLKEEKYSLISELKQLKETQEYARNSFCSEPSNKRRKIDSSSSSSSFYDFPEYIFDEDENIFDEEIPNPF